MVLGEQVDDAAEVRGGPWSAPVVRGPSASSWLRMTASGAASSGRAIMAGMARTDRLLVVALRR
jgi:hypothetical protein